MPGPFRSHENVWGAHAPRRELNTLDTEKTILKYRSKPCLFFLQPAGCPYGDRCLYAHGNDEIREDMVGGAPGSSPDNNPRYKTQLCRWWQKSEGKQCPHGIRCTFAHGTAELDQYLSLASKTLGDESTEASGENKSPDVHGDAVNSLQRSLGSMKLNGKSDAESSQISEFDSHPSHSNRSSTSTEVSTDGGNTSNPTTRNVGLSKVEDPRKFLTVLVAAAEAIASQVGASGSVASRLAPIFPEIAPRFLGTSTDSLESKDGVSGESKGTSNVDGSLPPFVPGVRSASSLDFVAELHKMSPGSLAQYLNTLHSTAKSAALAEGLDHGAATQAANQLVQRVCRPSNPPPPADADAPPLPNQPASAASASTTSVSGQASIRSLNSILDSVADALTEVLYHSNMKNLPTSQHSSSNFVPNATFNSGMGMIPMDALQAFAAAFTAGNMGMLPGPMGFPAGLMNGTQSNPGMFNPLLAGFNNGITQPDPRRTGFNKPNGRGSLSGSTHNSNNLPRSNNTSGSTSQNQTTTTSGNSAPFFQQPFPNFNLPFLPPPSVGKANFSLGLPASRTQMPLPMPVMMPMGSNGFLGQTTDIPPYSEASISSIFGHVSGDETSAPPALHSFLDSPKLSATSILPPEIDMDLPLSQIPPALPSTSSTASGSATAAANIGDVTQLWADTTTFPEGFLTGTINSDASPWSLPHF